MKCSYFHLTRVLNHVLWCVPFVFMRHCMKWHVHNHQKMFIKFTQEIRESDERWLGKYDVNETKIMTFIRH